jgi:RHS repeat-associated protein
VIEERTESGLIVASYVYGAGLDPISLARSGQPIGLYLADGHSGVRQVVDLLTAAVLAAYRYDAFGNKVATAGTFTDPIGYRGERFDATLGQYYLRARPYDPRSGRFTAIDQFAGTLALPVTLHRYLCANANPLFFADPSGLVGDPNIIPFPNPQDQVARRWRIGPGLARMVLYFGVWGQPAGWLAPS